MIDRVVGDVVSCQGYEDTGGDIRMELLIFLLVFSFELGLQ